MRLHVRVAQLFATLVVAMMPTGPAPSATDPAATGLDALAERYVRLVLAIGEHDPDFVDAYYGPPQWRDEARAHKRPVKELEQEAERLAEQVRAAQAPDAESELRRRSLAEQLTSIRTRLELLDGRRLAFDEEARRVYGVSPPHHDDDYYRAVHRDLEAVVPGQGTLAERMDAFKKRLIVPRERIRAALETALGACRTATLAHIALPPGENFRLELVKDKPWGAYNWYQGNYQSVIEVNVGLPVYASGIARLMGHEGYPGHHVLNTLLEQRLVKARGWLEYTVYPLFSAESLLAEGTADFGLELVFPGDERWQWDRDRLYPLLGIDPALAETSYRVAQLQKALGYAGIDAARACTDGTRSKEQTIAWLQEFTFATPDEASRSIKFMETYRSYVVNYRLGEDLVRQHIDKVAGTNLDARWSAFEKLLSSPVIVSDLARGTTLDPVR